MRKIETKREKRKKDKKTNFIVSIVLILVLALSTFGIVANSFGSQGSSEKVDYRGYLFEKQGNYWNLEVGEMQFRFLKNPFEVENLTGNFSDLNKLPSYASKPLYLYSENSIASSEIYFNLNPFLERIQLACYEEGNCDGNHPIKNCSNNFLIIKDSSKNKIYQKENCVFIEGNSESLPELSDFFLFDIFGIRES